MPAGQKTIFTSAFLPDGPEADISIRSRSLVYIFIGFPVSTARSRNESSQSPTPTRGRGDRARNQRHAGGGTERSAAGSKRGRQRSARPAGHEARAGIHQRQGDEQGAIRRDQGARTCFRVHPAGAGRAAATPPRAGTAFHAGSFPRASRAHRAALEGNEEGQSARALRVFSDPLSVFSSEKREASIGCDPSALKPGRRNEQERNRVKFDCIRLSKVKTKKREQRTKN